MSIDRCMDKENVVHIHNGIWATEKNEIVPITAMWMDLRIIILSEVNLTEKGKYHMILLICGILKENKKDTSEFLNFFTKQKQTHWKQTYGCQRRRGVVGDIN